MIVDDSFSRLTTRMIVHDSFSVSCLVITGPIAVRKHAASLFRREKIHALSLSYGTPFSIHIFTRKERGTRCARDFACAATAGELSSTITNFFGRLTI